MLTWPRAEVPGPAADVDTVVVVHVYLCWAPRAPCAPGPAPGTELLLDGGLLGGLFADVQPASEAIVSRAS